MTHLIDDLHLCERCSLLSSDIWPDLSIYDRSYEIKYDRYERTSTGKKIQALRVECVLRHVFANAWTKPVRLLDFGCGVGSFLKALPYDEEMKSSGFDINPYTQYCDVSVLFGHYDVVTFWDSLEHLRDPKKIIHGLSPKYLFVCTPSTDDYSERAIYRSRNKHAIDNRHYLYGYVDIRAWRHYMPVEHCHYFNEKSLCELIKLCGYEILEVNYSESGPRDGGGDKNILTVAAKRTGHNGAH
jgi:hypothetical protein